MVSVVMLATVGLDHAADIAQNVHPREMAPPGHASSEQAEASSFGDGRRPRSAAELVTNVRHVPMDSVRADDQLLGDLTVAETGRDELEHLALASGQQNRGRFPVQARGLALDCRCRAKRPDDAVGIAGPREVGGPLECNKRRARYPGGHLATEPVRDRAVPTAVDNQRWRFHE